MVALGARIRVIGLVVAATLLLGLVGTAPAEAAGRATVTEPLHVRSAPTTRATIIGTLRTRQTVTTRSTRAGWTTISFGSRTAYVAAKYLRAATAPAPSPGSTSDSIAAGSVRATTTALNVRAGAGTGYAVKRVLAPRTRVTMTGQVQDGFAQLVAGPATGWASIRYLKATTGVPAIVSTRVATVALDLRTASDGTSRTVGEVAKGTRLAITGVTANGRAQIVRRGIVRWVTARYLALPESTMPGTPALPRVTGTRYATTALDIRSTSADAYEAVSEVPRGTALEITGVVRRGRMQIIFEGAVRWVTAKYLSRTRPTTTGGGGYGVEKGLKPNAVKVHRAAMKAFPQIVTYYGVRKDPIPDHPSGRALDLMLPGRYRSASSQALGYRVRDWARSHARELGIQYVIFHQHIWNIQRDREGWRLMGDRGSDTANHINHVHITVYG